MDQARQAVLGMDRNIAQQIWVRERLVDAQDIKIDTQVEDFIALYTPVAVDLRFVLAMLKINSDLERIGDYAYSIARFVKETESRRSPGGQASAGADVRHRAGDDERAAVLPDGRESLESLLCHRYGRRAGPAQGRFRQHPGGVRPGAYGRASGGPISLRR